MVSRDKKFYKQTDTKKIQKNSKTIPHPRHMVACDEDLFYIFIWIKGMGCLWSPNQYVFSFIHYSLFVYKYKCDDHQ